MDNSDPFEQITDDWYFYSLLNKEARFVSHILRGVTYFIQLEFRTGASYDVQIKKDEAERFLSKFLKIDNYTKEKTEDELVNETLRGDYSVPENKEQKKLKVQAIKKVKKISNDDEIDMPVYIGKDKKPKHFTENIVVPDNASNSTEAKNKVIDRLMLETEQLKKERTELLETISELKKGYKREMPQLENNPSLEYAEQFFEKEKRIINDFPPYEFLSKGDFLKYVSPLSLNTTQIEIKQNVIDVLITKLNQLKTEDIDFSIENDDSNITHYRLNRKIIKFIRHYDFPTIKSTDEDLGLVIRVKETFICVAMHRHIKPIFDVHRLSSQILHCDKEEVLNRIFIDWFYLQEHKTVGDWFYENYLEFEWDFIDFVIKDKPLTKVTSS